MQKYDLSNSGLTASKRIFSAEELTRRRETGYHVVGLEGQIQQAIAEGTDTDQVYTYKVLLNTTRRSDWPYDEPSTSEKIHKALPAAPTLPACTLTTETFYKGVYNVWSGDAQALNLGRSVEGWGRTNIHRSLHIALIAACFVAPDMACAPEASSAEIPLSSRLGCNGAIAGSAFDAMYGAQVLPSRWMEPLNTYIRSAVFGFDQSLISVPTHSTCTLAHVQ